MYRTNFPDAPRPYTRRPNGSVKEQFKASWLTAIIGCCMFSAGMWILFWNEGQAVHTAKALEEALNIVVQIEYTTVVMEENNGKLVYFSGHLHVGEPLVEPYYGVSVPAVKLKRRVQMYQWVEEEHSREIPGDREFTDTTYSYSMEWKDKLIDSTSFYSPGRHNPKEFPLKSKVYVSEHVSVGGYLFSEELKDKFTDFVLVTSDERPERRDIKLHAGLYYHSQDVWNPDIGDIRVQFSYAGKAGDVVSVVGMQSGKEIKPYITHSGGDILMLRNGRVSVEEMFMEEKARNELLTWAYRGLGWLVMFLGSNCLTNILHIIVLRYSILYDLLLLEGVSSVSMAVATSGCLLIMSLAWIWYRPMLAALLILCSTIPFIFSAIRLYRANPQDSRYQRL